MQDALLAWLPNVTGTVFAQKRPPLVKHERTWGGAAFYRIYATQATAATSCSAARNRSSSATCSPTSDVPISSVCANRDRVRTRRP